MQGSGALDPPARGEMASTSRARFRSICPPISCFNISAYVFERQSSLKYAYEESGQLSNTWYQNAAHRAPVNAQLPEPAHKELCLLYLTKPFEAFRVFR
jgi:hypothetical protein